MAFRRATSMQTYVFFAIATFVLFGITNFILKKVSNARVSDHLLSTTFLWIAVGLAGLAGLFYFILQGKAPEIASGSSGLRFAFIAGLTLAVGMYTLLMGMASGGKAGVVVAIAQANAALVAILAFIFLKESLSPRELAGMGLIFGGIALMVV